MTRIKIAIGAIQIEYEGSQEFLQEGLLDLTSRVLELAEKAGVNSEPNALARTMEPVPQGESLSTNTIAQLIGVKTGSELALAAVAKIILVSKKPTADRQFILDEMKEAVTFYKESYSSNLSAYLDTLVKSRRLNIVSRGTYGLASAERGRLEQALATGGA